MREPKRRYTIEEWERLTFAERFALNSDSFITNWDDVPDSIKAEIAADPAPLPPSRRS